MSCQRCHHSKDPFTICADCDREFIMIDVRHYRAMRDGTFRLKKKLPKLETKNQRKRKTR